MERGPAYMSRTSLETIGFRYTGWAALNRDPAEDFVEFTCPHCGAKGSQGGPAAPVGISLQRRLRARFARRDDGLQGMPAFPASFAGGAAARSRTKHGGSRLYFQRTWKSRITEGRCCGRFHGGAKNLSPFRQSQLKRDSSLQRRTMQNSPLPDDCLNSAS